MMKSYIRIIIATMLLFGACKTQKPAVKDSVSQTPVETVQPKTDTVVYNYPPPRNYNIPKRIFKEIENFETAFDELKAMLEDKIEPNFERAVFVSENPYHGSKYIYEDFQRNVDLHLIAINKLIKVNDKSDSIDFNVKVNQYGRFNMDDIRHLPEEKKSLYKKAVVNWAIFKYITDTIYLDNTKTIFHTPYIYSTYDPFGIKDWSNSQVINLLYSQEQKGNCFALTAFFKILSDRLSSDSRLCTAPQHIYIQHRDKKGDYYNVELATAGHPGDGTIQTLTHTTTEGIKSGIALRSYNTKQSIGLCLVNLAKSYEHKFGSKDDDFMLKCAELVLKHDKLNLNALLLKQQILDTRVTDYAKENNINDINSLKSNSAISKTVYELERHLALLYQLGYRQMPFDMQEIIMTGVIPENFEDKNPTPFTTIDPKDEHRKKFTTLYGGLFQEVFVTREFEPYGHFTFQTSSNKITVIDTTAQTGFLIDPVAFAYDFGARMYDARLGRFLSVDAKFAQAPSWTPYRFGFNNPILYTDNDGNFEVPVHAEITKTVAKLKNLTSAQTYFLTMGVKAADYLGFAEDWHFDGRMNFKQIQDNWAIVNQRIENRPSWDYYGLGADLHTVQDFYAHSNYVELYIQYYQDQGGDMAKFSEDNIPLFDEGIQDENFKTNYLEKNLRTGDFDLVKNEKNPAYKKEKLKDNTHYRINKDSNDSPHGGEKVKGTNKTYHDVAKSVATRASKKVLDKKLETTE